MSAATRSAPRGARSRRAPDRLCAEAVDLAREAAEETAAPSTVGEWIEAVADGDRVVTHYFEAHEPGYRGWRWGVTVARASRAKKVTVDESVLQPGPDALLAPAWLPWNERLRPGDLGPGDLLPTEPGDVRLEPGWTGEDEPPPNSVVAGEEPAAPGRAALGAVAEEPGMGRARVLSRLGLQEAADRWEEAYGPRTAMAQSAPANCVSCGFLMPLAGSLRQAFGVCANEFSPADGHVVSLAYGCGGHSEAALMPRTPQPPPPVIDETRNDPFSLTAGPAVAEPSDGEDTGRAADADGAGEAPGAGAAGDAGDAAAAEGADAGASAEAAGAEESVKSAKSATTAKSAKPVKAAKSGKAGAAEKTGTTRKSGKRSADSAEPGAAAEASEPAEPSTPEASGKTGATRRSGAAKKAGASRKSAEQSAASAESAEAPEPESSKSSKSSKSLPSASSSAPSASSESGASGKSGASRRGGAAKKTGAARKSGARSADSAGPEEQAEAEPSAPKTSGKTGASGRSGASRRSRASGKSGERSADPDGTTE